MGPDVDEPTLSLFLPNYHHNRFLPEALNSLERQTCQPRKIIVVDDVTSLDKPRC